MSKHFDRPETSAERPRVNEGLNWVSLQPKLDSGADKDRPKISTKAGEVKEVRFDDSIYRTADDGMPKKPQADDKTQGQQKYERRESDRTGVTQVKDPNIPPEPGESIKQFKTSRTGTGGTRTVETRADGSTRETLRTKDGKLTFEAIVRKDGTQEMRDFHENGNVKNKHVLSPGKDGKYEIYEYDEQGRVTSRKEHNSDGSNRHSTFTEGRLSKTVETRRDGFEQTTTYGPTGLAERRDTRLADGGTRSERINMHGKHTYTFERDRDGTTRLTTHRQDGTRERTDIAYADGSRARRYYDFDGNPSRENRRWAPPEQVPPENASLR